MEVRGMRLRQKKVAVFVIIVGFLAALTSAPAQPQKEFSDWPEGTSPRVIGKRVAENFIVRPFRAQSDPTKARSGIIYPEVCAWYGALTFAQLSGDKSLQSRLLKKLDQLMSPAESGMISQSPHVDFRVFGTVPLEACI